MSYSYLWIKDDLRVRNNLALTRFLENSDKKKKYFTFTIKSHSKQEHHNVGGLVMLLQH